MSLVKELYDRKRLVELLSVHDRYPEYLEFFQSEIEKKGMVKTVQEYVLAGDEAADLMLKKMYAGALDDVCLTGRRTVMLMLAIRIFTSRHPFWFRARIQSTSTGC